MFQLTVTNLLGLLSVPALVALNGLFVAAEFALVSVRRTRVEEMVQQGVKGARSVEKAIGNLNRSIAATQLGITLTSIGLGWTGEPTLARLLDPLLDFLPKAWSLVTAHTAANICRHAGGKIRRRARHARAALCEPYPVQHPPAGSAGRRPAGW